ncbi:MAG: antibiotic biosynthesis monooxygenase [Desulfarculus sp.]|jgi:heme-degrading monooxygenase HmoA|nr:MAG: antibiotic biosynthesis monooxygenase [Desulfarculus sp.]
MIAVIFEVYFKPGQEAAYLEIAQSLREHVLKAPGFIAMERFRSIPNEGKICSLSFWEDEASVEAWKNFPQHRAAQQRGKEHLFSKYRIRVAKVLHELNQNYDD